MSPTQTLLTTLKALDKLCDRKCAEGQNELRVEIIRGLRGLADFMEQNPSGEVPYLWEEYNDFDNQATFVLATQTKGGDQRL